MNIVSMRNSCEVNAQAVLDAAYGKTGFKSEAERVAFLFERYQQLAAPLVAGEKAGKKKTSAKVKP